MLAQIQRTFLHQIVAVAQYTAHILLMLYIRIYFRVYLLHSRSYIAYEKPRLRKHYNFRHFKHVLRRDFFFENFEFQNVAFHFAFPPFSDDFAFRQNQKQNEKAMIDCFL